MSSIPSNRSAWEGRDEEEGERGDGGVGKDVNQVGRHHWYSTKMHLFVGNYFLIPFGKSVPLLFEQFFLPQSLPWVSPLELPPVFCLRYFWLSTKKNRNFFARFQPLSSPCLRGNLPFFIHNHLFRLQIMATSQLVEQSLHPLNVSLPLVFYSFFCPHWLIPPCKLVWSVRQTKRGDCNNCLGGKCSESISIYKNKQGSRKDL